VFLSKDQALNYARGRASFRSGEIRVLDSAGSVEETITFSEADRRLWFTVADLIFVRPQRAMDYEQVAFWVATSSLVLQAISMIPRKKEDRSSEDEAALVALSEAYHATQAYYSGPAHSRDAAARMAIADKWCRVGVLLKKYDRRLANRLDVKSRYWRQGATWTKAAIREAKIGLDDIWRETNVRLQQA
jgi:hypothetical protein